ncbi:MAG: hypothetical protein A2252_09030 [Elusimicrobia bacterium RIFOXYA2_FULL_39_19]|nr:MAG: hypothetical protein A2252_09030 [Elusimicrobia bacterium RIFOXYA2_FULL_39_19]
MQKRKTLIGLLIAIYFTVSAFAENYTKVPLWGGDVQIAAVAPSNSQVVYVGSAYNGTYVTTDGGAIWSSIKFLSEYGNNGAQTIAVHPTLANIVVAGTWGSYSNSVMRSDDYGVTWANVSQSITNLSISKIVASKKTSGTFYLAGTETGPNAVIYQSTDAGLTWGNKKTVVSGKYAKSIAVDDNDNLYVTVQNATDIYGNDYSGFLYKSTDGGASWTLIRSFNFWPDSVQVASNTVLINANANSSDSAAAGLSEISNDGGVTFISSTTCTLYRSGRYLSPDGSKMYYYSQSSGRELSVSSAPAWNSYTVLCGSVAISYTQMGAKQGALIPVAQDPNLFYLTNSELGIMKSTDACASWQAANTGMGGVVALNGCKDENGNMYMIGNITLYKGTNNGQNWRKIYCPDEIFGISPRVGGVVVAPSTSVVLYAARNDLYRSADGGVTWPAQSVLSLTSNNGKITGIVFNKDNPSICYLSYSSGSVNAASSGQYLYKSTDCGVTWAQLSFTGNSVQSLAIDPSDPTIIYAGIGDLHGYGNSGVETFGGMWKIVDDGTNAPIKTQLTGIDNHIPYKIMVDTSGIVFAACRNSGDDSVVMYSNDGGTAWQQSSINLNSINDIAYSRGVYYVSNQDNIYATIFLGQEFSKVTDSSEIGNIQCLVIGSMYGGADSGLYKLNWAPEVLTETLEKPRIVTGPNPFNPHTGSAVLKYSVPQGQTADSIKISIYNIAGELIYSRSSSGYLTGGYIYSYSWDGKNSGGDTCASGVYIAVVSSNLGMARTKFAVIK